MPTIEPRQIAKFKVAHLYPPYEGKGKAKIVADNGTKYSCEESQLESFRDGEDVAIYFTKESFKDKKTGELVAFNKFVSKIETNGATPAKQFDRASTSAKDAAHIATLALAKEYVARGDTPADAKHITRLLDMCFDGYMASRLAGNKKQVAADMNDEILESGWETYSENPAD